eukprot:213583-Karenia_brevis.AAC.1
MPRRGAKVLFMQVFPIDTIKYQIRYQERWRFKHDYHHRLDSLGDVLHNYSEENFLMRDVQEPFSVPNLAYLKNDFNET